MNNFSTIAYSNNVRDKSEILATHTKKLNPRFPNRSTQMMSQKNIQENRANQFLETQIQKQI